MMASRLLKAGESERGFSGYVNRAFDRLKESYAGILRRTMRVRPAIYVAWILLSTLSIILFVMSPKELAPAEDQGVVFGVVNTPANSTLEQIRPSTDAVDRIAMEFPETAFTFQLVSPTGGFWGMGLRPWDQRERSAEELLAAVQAEVERVPGIETFPILPPALPGGGQFPVEFVIASTAEHEEILGYARQLQRKATESGIFAFPPLIDVKVDQPESEIVIDRDKAAQLGLDLQSIGQDIASALGGNFVNRFSVYGRSYKVIPQIRRQERLNPDQLDDIRVAAPDGSSYPSGPLRPWRIGWRHGRSIGSNSSTRSS